MTDKQPPKDENASKIETLKTLDQLVFSATYSAFRTDPKDQTVWPRDGGLIEGYCPSCKKNTTWRASWPTPLATNGPETITLRCRRIDSHRAYVFVVRKERGHTFIKTGQFPAASISHGAEYLKSLFKHTHHSDADEFGLALRAAAEGYGIGSLVYLRRIFERLIRTRIDEAVEQGELKKEQFRGKGMREKINLLKDHLPDFLVEHSQIYAILSKGMHELTEEECQRHFDTLQQSIRMIVEEDNEARDRLERRRALSVSIREIDTTKS